MLSDARSWIADVALACLAVAVVAFAGWVLMRDPEPETARPATETSATTPASSASATATGAPESDTLSVLVLGDESVRGARSAGRWVTELQGGDVEITNRSRPQSGYVVDGPDDCGLPACPSVTKMFAQAEAAGTAPDVVLLSAGTYDAVAPEAALRRGLTAFFDELTATYPEADVVVLSPVVRAGAEPTGLDRVATVLSAEAERVGADFVDAGQPYLDAAGAAGSTEAERLRAAGEQLRTTVDEVLDR